MIQIDLCQKMRKTIEKKRKTASITFHCSYNYGSALQAFALQRFLQKNGYENDIVNYISSDFDVYRLVPVRLTKKNVILLIRTIMFFPFFLRRKRSFRAFLNNHLQLSGRKITKYSELIDLNSRYDVFISGGDQIWNLDCIKGGDLAFFLDFVNDDKRKISYAPSLAKAMFDEDYSEVFIRFLQRYDFISVREKSSLEYLRSLTDKPVSCTLDPTLLIDSGEYPIKCPKHASEQEYIFMYMLALDYEMIDYCNALGLEKRMPVYYITKTKMLHKKNRPLGKDMFGISPEEFLFYLSHARYVITNSFHGTVFSILFKKEFCVFHSKTTGMRTKDLISELLLPDREYSADFNIDKPINYLSAYDKLDELRKLSMRYLIEAIEE